MNGLEIKIPIEWNDQVKVLQQAGDRAGPNSGYSNTYRWQL